MQNMINDYKSRINTLEGLLDGSRSRAEKLERDLRETISKSKESEDKHMKVINMLQSSQIQTIPRKSKPSNKRSNTRGSTSADRNHLNNTQGLFSTDVEHRQNTGKLKTKKLLLTKEKEIMMLNPTKKRKTGTFQGVESDLIAPFIYAGYNNARRSVPENQSLNLSSSAGLEKNENNYFRNCNNTYYIKQVGEKDLKDPKLMKAKLKLTKQTLCSSVRRRPATQADLLLSHHLQSTTVGKLKPRSGSKQNILGLHDLKPFSATGDSIVLTKKLKKSNF